MAIIQFGRATSDVALMVMRSNQIDISGRRPEKRLGEPNVHIARISKRFKIFKNFNFPGNCKFHMRYFGGLSGIGTSEFLNSKNQLELPIFLRAYSWRDGGGFPHTRCMF